METFHHDGMRFDVTDAGPPDGRVVLVLHGFPQDRSAWAGVTPRLAAAGHRVLAPDQRGYSPGAVAPRRRDYRMRRLAADVLALADQAGADTFDVVGHDWGAAVAWHLAARHPDRVRTVTALSVPHPRAWAQSVLRSAQALRSTYMAFFQLPRLPERALSAGAGARLRRSLVRDGLGPEYAGRYAARAARPGNLTGPLNWYRAIPFDLGQRTPTVAVPALMLWSDGDRFLSRTGAELSARWCTGPFRLEVLEGVSHWIPETAPERTAALILEHLESVPAGAGSR